MRRGGSVRPSCACSREQKNREKFAQMRIWTAWRTSLRARLPESGWRPKPARVVTPFEISPPLRQERTWHQIAEYLPNDGLAVCNPQVLISNSATPVTPSSLQEFIGFLHMCLVGRIVSREADILPVLV